ncbi:dihydrolipoyl dehydrogenase [Vagococcus fluvialis]|uniref:dihydrolipoyl dehydrogenase n=1 Tax=Vagococcus fluvialis TaxID=2738 RepID=UPI001D0A4A62|nr:dihydrolipoyl dehydrogenase [Vagococcus fluvialis]UDM69945.1 dihydrolipoyl dehydrogenase [Vagococcus fluvialis]UDM77362.1 dihydrolipoyl dehydrogenase [Vagococcus fluvialis]UDM81632.1 dihydrolipoyl dehydrogenase [Vagococcus fluvialis]
MVVGDFESSLGTVVVGSGPGGYVAAIRAAQLGQKVTLIERDNIGGTCLNVGCIPSKALIQASHHYNSVLNSPFAGINSENATLDFTEVQNWKDNHVVKKLTEGVKFLLKKNKVDVLEGSGYFMDENRIRVMNEYGGDTYRFENVIIATGSAPIEIPGFKFRKRVLDSTGVLNLKEVPKKLVVIGGGYIGSELAGVFANLGTEVTILEGQSSILPNFDKKSVSFVEKSFKKLNVTIETNALAKKAENAEDSVTVTYEVDGKEKEIICDYVLVSVGRKPNTNELGLERVGIKTDERGLIVVDEQCRTTLEHVYAIGDIIPGLALAHKASYEGKVAAEAISGHDVAVDYKAMPAVCFTDPELAATGLTKEEAKSKGYEPKVSEFPLAGNGRALSMNKAEGLVQIISDKNTGEVLGGQIAGVNASDLISEITLAIETSATIEDLSLTVHPHPTVSETIMEAAEVGLGLPIHI